MIVIGVEQGYTKSNIRKVKVTLNTYEMSINTNIIGENQQQIVYINVLMYPILLLNKI